MRIVRTIAAMQKIARDWQRTATPAALVPTMGFLHPGHASLMRKARRRIGAKGRVVVSLFVNPTQFGQSEDLQKYPRNFSRDRQLCQTEGVDVLFAPSAGAMYPPDFSTWVVEEKLSQGMEGSARPGHFRGVATVVAKLFLIVQPTAAFFGAKDFQQAAVVKRMVRDLNFPLKIWVEPTLREPDGLAMSSRNKYLNPTERAQAAILRRAFLRARHQAGSLSSSKLAATLKKWIERESEARVDYISFFDPLTLQPVAQPQKGTRLALAARVGKTRLIDNDQL